MNDFGQFEQLIQRGYGCISIVTHEKIEKAFASAASHSADGGLSQRMFGTLLTWLQEREEPVFVAATANDIEALPPELLRKGRFDEIFYVDLPDAKVREEIFAIHIKKHQRDPAKFDLSALAQASHDYSGAEIEQARHRRPPHGLRRQGRPRRRPPRHGHPAVPPLSTTMAEKVSAFRRWAKGRCVPAG